MDPNTTRVTHEDYTRLDASHSLFYRVFQRIPGSSEWYLRIIMSFDSSDDLLTFGPMDADRVDHLATALSSTYCEYYCQQSGIFESAIALGLRTATEGEVR